MLISREEERVNTMLVRARKVAQIDLPVKHDDRGSVREVFCRGCRAKIAGMVISDQEPQHVAIGDKLVVVTPVEFVHLSGYAEGIMEFDDNSAHVTNACVKCMTKAKKEQDFFTLEDWYVQDLAVFLKEIQLTGQGELHDRMLNRTPVRIV